MKKTIMIFIISMLLIQIRVYAQETLPDSIKNEIKDSIIMRLYSSEVYIDGQVKNIDDNDTKPYISNDRTLAPLRFVGENFGCLIEWDPIKKLIILAQGEKVIKMNIGKREMYVNDSMIWLDATPEIKNNRTFVPLRAISEALNKKNTFMSDIIIISDKDMNSYAYKEAIVLFAQSNLRNERDLYIGSITPTIYSDIKKNPQNYIGKRVAFSGEVIQLYQEYKNGITHTFFRLLVHKRNYNEVILVSMVGDCPIAEKKIVAIYGESMGPIEYVSEFGFYVSIPFVNAKYYKLPR